MVSIVDQFGKPIRREALAEPQTARVGGLLHQEFEDHPSRGLKPAKLAAILEAAEQGDLAAQCDLFDDMEEKDGHILAEMGKRKRALLTLDWNVSAPRNASAGEQKMAEYVRDVLLSIPDFEDLLLDLLDGIGKGFSCAEIGWGRDGAELVPQAVTYRPARWFTVDQATRTELRLRTLGALDGVPLNQFGWVTHVHKAKSGSIARGGLHRALAWPFLFKNYSVRDLAEFLEIYGLPLRLGTYRSGASAEEKATLMRAVVNIGHAAAGIVPEGMAIEFKEAAKGASDPFEAMISWCERTQSKAILGGTLTSQADGKSSTNALGNVHNEVRWDLTVSDAKQLAGTITRDLIYPILAVNKGLSDIRRCPRFVFDTSDTAELNAFSMGLNRLINAGLRVPANWVYEKTKIPVAKDDDEILAASTQDSGKDSATLKATIPVNTVALRAQQEPADPTPVTALAEQMEDEASAAWGGIMDQVKALVDGADSLQELRDKLLAAYDSLSTDDLAEVMATGFSVAKLTGRFDVSQGN